MIIISGTRDEIIKAMLQINEAGLKMREKNGKLFVYPPSDAEVCVYTQNNNKIDGKLKAIRTIICHYFGVTLFAFLSKSRAGHLPRARQFFTYFSSIYTKATVYKIGDYANIDHSTISRNKLYIPEIVATDKKYREWHEDLTKIINKKIKKND